MLAQLTNVSLSFPDKKVLQDVSFTVYPGDRISLVGPNGAGKTSLFKILTGRLNPDAGAVSRAGGVRIGHLEQDLSDSASGHELTCMEAALEPFAGLIRLEKRLEEIAVKLGREGHASVLMEELGEAQRRFEDSGGYSFRARTEATLTGLGLPESLWDREVSGLSAGQRMRLALARILLEEHDLVLFDEPTNHLDVPAREWLEGHLKNSKVAYMVASHDRRFLDAVSEKVAHLDRANLSLYTGDYTAFRGQVERAEEEGWRRYEKSRKQERKLRRQAQDYRAWSEAGERAKRGAADKGFVSHRAAKVMKRSLVARRRMEEAAENARAEKPFEGDEIKIGFGPSRGRGLIRAEDLTIGYSPERPLAAGISFDLSAGERLAVTGPNGSGKTALLRTVLGEVQPLSGGAGVSPTARVGYFDQDHRLPARDVTALEILRGTGDETLARTVLGRMGVRRETVSKPASRLSSGERAKVLLTRLVLGDNDLLVLDEPTNHLDIETQDVLLGALEGFPGGVLFVSHDRHFVDALATKTLRLGIT
ncbi:ATP-binding cassette domain-containing protein [Rubrobacter tropicus]|uniref:ATP-binding cassette domain-containing protein n=1 Tax=Rubrobacter tropicus TaxID=2653851 RepID=A0A6G8QC46_9ACTN|nr:ABC-F family ATP-binding cassette domain-containing protein [Rubrobacter tropicus]QIN84013.1 ATP-binding cassette domain-containing protein [Rubrobacter tropicus]